MLQGPRNVNNAVWTAISRSLAFSGSCKFVVKKQEQQNQNYPDVSHLQDWSMFSGCPLSLSILILPNFLSVSHVLFFVPQHVDLVPYSTLFDREILHKVVCVTVCVSVCVRGGPKKKHSGERESSEERRRKRERAVRCPALKLPVYFQSLHQLHWYSLKMGPCVCVYVGDGGWNRKTIRNDRYGDFFML